MILEAMLSGAIAPGRVSQGNLVPGEGPDQEQFIDLSEAAFQACWNLALKKESGAASWSQAWEGSLLTSILWTGLDLLGPVGHSPKK